MTFLVGDIGGTKTLLALIDSDGGKLKKKKQKKYHSANYKGLEDIVADFLKEEEGPLYRACFAIAGPIEEGVSHTTNLPWSIYASKLSEQFRIEQTHLINDLVANAWGIQRLSASSFVSLNEGRSVPTGNQGLVSPGTGLGEAPLFFNGKEHIPSPSEGGHSDFSPRDEIEIELFKYLKGKFGHVSFERTLSGHGLVNLYQFLIDTAKYKEDNLVAERMKKEDPAEVISEMAISKKCNCCQRALAWFCSILGSEAGNFALKILSTGGVFIGGGIAPKILSELKKGGFMEAFTDKGRLSPILSSIPVNVILDEDTALKGAAYYCLRTTLEEKN